MGQITVTKQMRTETGHRLMNYDGRCSHLHGHSYLWEVTATKSTLDNVGFVLDFKDLKKAMEYVLDPWDHAMVLCISDPIVPILQKTPATNGALPRIFITAFNPTAENLAAYAARHIQSRISEDTTITKVRVWETATCYAEWRKDDNPKTIV